MVDIPKQAQRQRPAASLHPQPTNTTHTKSTKIYRISIFRLSNCRIGTPQIWLSRPVDLRHARKYRTRACHCGISNTRQAKSPTRRRLRKSAPGSTRSCDPESTSICGDVGEVDPQSRSVAATRGWPAAAGQGARLIGVDLRSTQRGRPRVDFDRSRPAVDSAKSPQGRL